MKQTMKPSALATSIVTALYAIRHDGTDYETGDLLEVPKTQAVFLRMAKCVREPTAAEIEDWQAQKQTQKQAEEQAASLYVNKESSPVAQHTVATQTSTDMEADVVVDDTHADTEHADVVIDAVIGEAVSLPEATTEIGAEVNAKEEASQITNPYDGWLKKDLNAELDKRGIEHDAHARNDVLEQLLIEDDGKKA